MSTVNDAFGYLGELPVSYLATCVGDQPYVRTMMLINRDGRLYFATGSTDGKMSQLTQNPRVEVCVPIGENEGTVRMRGIIEFIYNEEVRAEIHGCTGFIQGFWSEPQDPDFVLMEFKPRNVELMKPGSTEIERAKV